jgi:uncharacterized OsmC-like protein
MTGKNLISEESINRYLERFNQIRKLGYTKEGDAAFIQDMIVTSEQISNLYVKASIGDYKLYCDEPENLGGTGKAPNPMQTLLGAFANCLELSAMLYFSFMNLEVSSVKVEVRAKYDKRSVLLKEKENLPGFYDISYTWYIHTAETKERIQRALNAIAESCPVKWTLQREHEFSQKLILNGDNKN